MAGHDTVRRILRRAVRRGLLTATQADALRSEARRDEPGSDLTQQLAPGPPAPSEAGPGVTLSPSSPPGPLPGNEKWNGGSDPAAVAGHPVPPEFPEPGWSRYEVLKLVGSGGMGRVFKARDPRLNRFVALKLLRWEDPDLLERFLREAQAQAQVEHDNVCPVYEVGQVAGQPYIAMQYIRGRSLKEVGRELTLEQKVVVVRQVASAAHAAHRLGLVHRDLKPANVLLERDEDGGWHPWVLDFGLVHTGASQGLTTPGMVVGTAAYMAPEQAQGDTSHLDRRTDVWGLGATLYELLTGVPPFAADSDVHVLMMVVGEEPTPPRQRDATIPPDLETIVLKCLEKEPQRRYESARAVAEELQRFLDGEPILARRASRGYRLARLLRRHRTAAALLAGTLALALGFAGLAAATAWRARARARTAQELAAEVSVVEETLRRAAMAPPHDVRPERAQVRARLDAIQTRVERQGGTASAAGGWALGRGYLALGEPELARTHLERAWQEGLRGPEVSWALGRALAALYERAVERAERAGSPDLRQRLREEAVTSLREPALRHLHASTAAELEVPAYLQAMLAALEDRPDEALRLAGEALARAPWLYEAKQLEGEVHQMRGRALANQGRYEEALAAYQLAGQAYAGALDIARSDPGLWESECSRLIEVVGVDLRRGRRPAELLDRTVATCTRALAIDPDQPRAAARVARIHCTLADHQRDHGVDPRPALSQAIEMARRAARPGGDPEALTILGWAQYQLGDYATSRGEDPRTWLDESVATFRRAVEAGERSVETLNAMGYALDRRAKWEVLQGLDPSPTLEEAIAAYSRAAALDPAFAPPRNNLGIAYFRRAEVSRKVGRDPGADLEASVASLREALAINPSYAYAWFNLGGTLRARGSWLAGSGRDPGPALEAARDAFARGTAINPDVFWVFSERIETELVAASWAIRQGASPAPFLAAGKQAVERGLTLNPSGLEVFLAGARLHLVEAEWRRAAGSPGAAASARTGLELARRALALNPSRSETLAAAGALHGVMARVGPGHTRAAELGAARDALRRALTANRLLELEYRPLLEELERLAP